MKTIKKIATLSALVLALNGCGDEAPPIINQKPIDGVYITNGLRIENTYADPLEYGSIAERLPMYTKISCNHDELRIMNRFQVPDSSYYLKFDRSMRTGDIDHILLQSWRDGISWANQFYLGKESDRKSFDYLMRLYESNRVKEN